MMHRPKQKMARISRKVEKTVQSAMDDGDFLAWAQYADPKIAGLSMVGMEHEAPINVLPLPISPYATPIATGTMDPIRIAGLAIFVFALVGSICLSKVAIRRRRKRETMRQHIIFVCKCVPRRNHSFNSLSFQALRYSLSAPARPLCQR